MKLALADTTLLSIDQALCVGSWTMYREMEHPGRTVPGLFVALRE